MLLSLILLTEVVYAGSGTDLLNGTDADFWVYDTILVSVMTKGEGNCDPYDSSNANMSCISPAFDVVYGNVSLRTALQAIANKGEWKAESHKNH